MLCPNDKERMHQAAVPSHYGEKVIIDQCGSCGGLWFDAFELYKVDKDALERIDNVDADKLRLPSELSGPSLVCPRDQTPLFQFEDSRFPASIVLMRCPECQGFWLNRGQFSQFHEARQQVKSASRRTAQDDKLDADVRQLLASHRDGYKNDVLAKAGSFLSTPVGGGNFLSGDASSGFADKGSVINPVLNVLITLLRLFILR